jgi:hypothetical protein
MLWSQPSSNHISPNRGMAVEKSFQPKPEQLIVLIGARIPSQLNRVLINALIGKVNSPSFGSCDIVHCTHGVEFTLRS